MSEKVSSTPSRETRSGGFGVGVGVGVGAVERTTMTGRVGAILMRSVSIFLTSGRKVSVVARKQQQSISTVPKSDRVGKIKRRRMPDDASVKNGVVHTKVIDSLKKKTKFSKGELEALCKIYRKLVTSSGLQAKPAMTINGISSPVQTIVGIDRTIFRELLHNTFGIITDDTLIEHMFCCWDRESEGAIGLESWILGLDVFLRGSLRDKMEFCFRVYDLNSDGYITKDEMFLLFKNCLIKQPGEEDPDEGVRDLSELALKKLDVDRDGKVSFRDYETAIKNEPLLLEAFGQCLPTEENSTAFLATLQSSRAS